MEKRNRESSLSELEDQSSKINSTSKKAKHDNSDTTASKTLSSVEIHGDMAKKPCVCVCVCVYPLADLESSTTTGTGGTASVETGSGRQLRGRHYTLSIAVPGSIVANAQSQVRIW